MNIRVLSSFLIIAIFSSLGYAASTRVGLPTFNSGGLEATHSIGRELKSLAIRKQIPQAKIKTALDMIIKAHKILGVENGYIRAGFISCLNIYRPAATVNALEFAQASAQGIIQAHDLGELTVRNLHTVGTKSMIDLYAQKFQISKNNAKNAVCTFAQKGHCKMFQTGTACI